MSISRYRDELKEIQQAAKEEGVKLNFFLGTWGAREVAYFLGLEYETVRHRRAGLMNLPVMRFGEGVKKTLRFRPSDVIAYREAHYQEALNRTPALHIARLKRVG